MRKILLIQFAKLGDFIQSTRLLANLRHSEPEAKIIILAKEASVLEAARLSPLIDKVLDKIEDVHKEGSIDSVYVLNSHLAAVRAGESIKCEKYFGPTSTTGGALLFPPAQKFIMSLMQLNRSLGRFNLVDLWASMAPSKGLSFSKTFSKTFWPKEKSSPLLENMLAKIPNELPLKGSCPNKDTKSLRENTKSLIGFQLGCRNHLRRWPLEHFVSLAKKLAGLGHKFTPVLLGSKDEKALAKKFAHLWGDDNLIDLSGATKLQELGEVVGCLRLLISSDTGVMHLGAALDVPVLALFFGPAYGPETGPYGPGHIIYQTQASCAPCLESASCRERQCREIPRADIAAVYAGWLLERILGKYTSPPLVEIPPGHRLWLSSLGSFGQDLYPIDNYQINANEALALCLSEAGRKLIKPCYKTDQAEFQYILKQYQGFSTSKPETNHKNLGAPRPFQNIDKRDLELIIYNLFKDSPSLKHDFRENLSQIINFSGLKFA